MWRLGTLCMQGFCACVGTGIVWIYIYKYMGIHMGVNVCLYVCLRAGRACVALGVGVSVWRAAELWGSLQGDFYYFSSWPLGPFVSSPPNP